MTHTVIVVGKRKVTCSCGQDGEYSDKWDSHYCPAAMVWLEEECSCSEDECEFRGRPDIPEKNPIEFYPEDRFLIKGRGHVFTGQKPVDGSMINQPIKVYWKSEILEGIITGEEAFGHNRSKGANVGILVRLNKDEIPPSSNSGCHKR